MLYYVNRSTIDVAQNELLRVTPNITSDSIGEEIYLGERKRVL